MNQVKLSPEVYWRQRGYYEASAPVEKRAKHLVCADWPRSGHHLVVRTLTDLLGRRFGYCEFYTPMAAGNSPCCGQFPCRKQLAITLRKNHDFDLKSRVPRNVPVLVQHRAFVEAVCSEFELHIRNGHEDKRSNFIAFVKKRLPLYRRFRRKWVVSDMPKRTLIDYADLVADPTTAFRKILAVMQVTDISDEALAEAIAKTPTARIGPAYATGVGVRKTRDVTEWKYYNKDLFEQWAERSVAVARPKDDAEASPGAARQTG